MRLIDADKAENDIVENVTTKAVSRVVAILQGQPTVEAIPLEWIKKWCNEHNRKSLEERLLKRYGVITMLEDWVKENGEKTV